MILMLTRCSTKTATFEDTIKDYYSSINKNNYKGTNPEMIAGWAAKTDNDRQYFEEFQGQIADIFKQHQGLKEVKIVSTIPGSTEAEVTLDVELICNDGYTEAVSHQMVKEGEAWKVAQ